MIAHSALYTGGVPDNYLIYVWLAMKNSLYQNNGWSRDLNQHKTDQWSCCLTCCPQRGSGNEGAAQKACSEDKDSVLKGRGLKLDVDKDVDGNLAGGGTAGRKGDAGVYGELSLWHYFGNLYFKSKTLLDSTGWSEQWISLTQS